MSANVKDKLKVGFIGCVLSSRDALKALIDLDCVSIEAVVTKQESGINSDFCDLSKLCREFGIPAHFENSKKRQESVNFLGKYELDVIYCFGWSYLLGSEILALPKIGVVGFHPAQLPKNRGRHPIIWSLSLGLEQTASSFFWMDEGADSGPILNQRVVNIDDSENAASLYHKIMQTAIAQIIEFTTEIASGVIIAEKQNDSEASYWRKRSVSDGMIDWRMSASSIYNLVRALSEPYPGADFSHAGLIYKITQADFLTQKYSKNIEPGKVLEAGDGFLVVKVEGEKAVKVFCDYGEKIKMGDYL